MISDEICDGTSFLHWFIVADVGNCMLRLVNANSGICIKRKRMANYTIKCEAMKMSGESGICPGSAKCRTGEAYVLTARTLEPTGMCGRAFAAIHPMAFAMRWSEKMDWEKRDFVDVTCPDGFVTSGLSRMKK
jgi:uncharacterized repeat protein (TIGR04076 family)